MLEEVAHSQQDGSKEDARPGSFIVDHDTHGNTRCIHAQITKETLAMVSRRRSRGSAGQRTMRLLSVAESLSLVANSGAHAEYAYCS